MITNNNLFTLSYFRKRLFDAEIPSRVLIRNYQKEDKRYWTISIDQEKQIFCTCFRDGEEFWFEFQDGKNQITNPLIIKTLSMKVIINQVKKWL